ncbi:AraC family transcriptional regulator [candidate division KSB1 bacterium]|nr:AraC family transcriptional regulator [candidate division KSB1 bacterium]
MQLSFNILSLILLLGAAQGFFLALLLFERKRNQTANRMLAFLVCFYSVYIGDVALLVMNYHKAFPHLIGLTVGLPFLFGPLHYLYVRLMISPGRSLEKRDWLHFLPYVIFKTYMLPFHLSSAAEKLQFLQNLAVAGEPLALICFESAMILQGNIYMILSMLLLRKHSRTVKDSFSSIDKINLTWLRNITIGTSCIWLLVLIFNILPALGLTLTENADHFIAPATSVFIYVMGYLSLRQREVHIEKFDLTRAPKYQKSGLSAEQAENYLHRLRQFMETKRVYAKNDLTLNELAEQIAIPAHHLSQIINDRLRQNFYDFVNNYRVEEAKRRLLDPAYQHLTILAIAYEVGFSSKSVFNAAFKKYANMTPSQFKKKVSE